MTVPSAAANVAEHPIMRCGYSISMVRRRAGLEAAHKLRGDKRR